MKKFKSKNLLVIGSTGSGRSNFIDKFITDFLKENDPEDFKLVLIDPKKVMFSQYNGVAHLLSEVIDSTGKAKSAFKWAWGEALRRIKLMDELGIDNIGKYKKSDKFRNKLPEIVIVIEEFADFMVYDAEFFDDYLARIASLSDVVGIHMIVATAKPVDEVLSKKIRSIFSDRIVFRLADEKASMLAMGNNQAMELDKPGSCYLVDMIDGKLDKIQMPFVSEDDIAKTIDSVKEEYSDFQILMDAKDEAEEKEEDILYETAKDIVVKNGKASASFLQRQLKIGYSRAARLIDMLEENGIISESNGAEPREVLI